MKPVRPLPRPTVSRVPVSHAARWKARPRLRGLALALLCLLFMTLTAPVALAAAAAPAAPDPTAPPAADADARGAGRPGAPLRVLAATFPVWLFTRSVCATVPGVSVELFVPADTGCPHEFSPSPADLRRLAGADAVILNGFGLESFMDAPLRTVGSRAVVIDAGSGIQPLRDADGINPHIFAGPSQAARMVRTIGAGLARLDPAHAAAYAANAGACATRLDALATELARIGEAAPRKGIALQHDALAYLARDAGLTVTAVLEPGDAGGALSAARLAELARLLEREKPLLIAGEPQYPDKAVRLLARETGIAAAQLDPVAAGPADAPVDYYEHVMQANAEILRRHYDVR